MVTRIYVRASTKEQDAERALDTLINFATGEKRTYIENESGTKLNRPELNRLLDESEQGDILLVESVDRLSRLTPTVAARVGSRACSTSIKAQVPPSF